MSTEIAFDFRDEDLFIKVRTLTIEGETFFRATDVANCLFLQTHAMLRMVDADDRIESTVLTNGGNQRASFLSESGLYTVLLRSNKQNAQLFRRWVTREVLPAIRRQGFYESERLKKELAHKDYELARKEQVILQLQAGKKKRNTPRLRVPNYNVFDGHEPIWELASMDSIPDPQKTLGLLRKTIAQIDGLRNLAMKYKKALGIAEK